MTEKLRFAPIIRVSTETQEKKGESLSTQEKMIREFVDRLGGVIPQYCWKYSGQEHATPGQERKKLEELLKDSKKNLFDAVIVCDASRWSRDNMKNEEGLELLRENGIRFFVGTTEHNLDSPQSRLILGMFSVINQFFALEQCRKSMENRIERARRGIPTGGKLPYGRIYNKTTGTWELDEEKAANIRWAATQYLQGKGLPEIARILNMNASNLWKILTRRAGDTWEIRFDSSRPNIHEAVPIIIPRILPQETIDKILERAASNKTYTHGEIKNKYLLSRMIFCGHCGYAMFGQTNHGNRRYYRHARKRKEECPEVSTSMWIPAEDIEKAVLVQLFSMFGDVRYLEKAIKQAIPDRHMLEKLISEKALLEKKLDGVKQEKERIIIAISKGIISDQDAGKKMAEIKDRESCLCHDIEGMNVQLKDLPSEGSIRLAARRMSTRLAISWSVYKSVGHYREMSYEGKRQLLEQAFAGQDTKGKRLGVYIEKNNKPESPWVYTVKGILSDVKGDLPMSKEEAQYLCNIDTDYCDDNPLDVSVETTYSLS